MLQQLQVLNLNTFYSICINRRQVIMLKSNEYPVVDQNLGIIYMRCCIPSKVRRLWFLTPQSIEIIFLFQYSSVKLSLVSAMKAQLFQ